MKTLADLVLEMSDENSAVAKLQAELSAAGGRRESLFWKLEELRKDYGKTIRCAVRARASRIVRRHSHAWCVDVTVVPLHNGITKVSHPLVEIRWADKGTAVTMTCVVMALNHLDEFLERFKAVVIASQLHRK